jgi:hypothetical protein
MRDRDAFSQRFEKYTKVYSKHKKEKSVNGSQSATINIYTINSYKISQSQKSNVKIAYSAIEDRMTYTTHPQITGTQGHTPR